MLKLRQVYQAATRSCFVWGNNNFSSNLSSNFSSKFSTSNFSSTFGSKIFSSNFISSSPFNVGHSFSRQGLNLGLKKNPGTSFVHRVSRQSPNAAQLASFASRSLLQNSTIQKLLSNSRRCTARQTWLPRSPLRRNSVEKRGFTKRVSLPTSSLEFHFVRALKAGGSIIFLAKFSRLPSSVAWSQQEQRITVEEESDEAITKGKLLGGAVASALSTLWHVLEQIALSLLYGSIVLLVNATPLGWVGSLLWVMSSARPSEKSLYDWLEKRQGADNAPMGFFDRFKSQVATILPPLVEFHGLLVCRIAIVSYVFEDLTVIGAFGTWWVFERKKKQLELI